jgi:Rrf2 family protein
MQLTMTGEYAVRAMVGLASEPFGRVVQVAQLSASWDIPENFLRKIVADLARAGLLSSKRGAKGGISLAVAPEELTLLDVIEAVEGKIFLNKCLIGPEFCDRTDWCAVHVVWCEAQGAVRDILKKRSLAEIVSLSKTRPARHSSFWKEAPLLQYEYPKTSVQVR